MKSEIIAMLLAGGKGTRLGSLTKKIAKPAVSFGGKYRIIDFPLSNCANSGVNVVGVLTQYESIKLNEYIGSGTKWGLDGNRSEAVLLPPRQKESGSSWYNGTADAIFHNIDFMDQYNPEYVLILSGDHIYKMDYSKMLAFHKENNADVTISVIKVPLEEASRFGIINANPDNTIYEFEEKPKMPKSNLASMGIYIFTYSKLKKYLLEEDKIERAEHDFGKHILPKMLSDKQVMMAYQFDGYWKDVGTIRSLWEANMDLLNEQTLDLFNRDIDWKIYSEDLFSLPQYIGPSASISNSLINQGSNIYGTVTNSIVFGKVTVEPGAVVDQTVLFPGSIIKKDAVVKRSIVAEDVVIPEGKKVNIDQDEIALISE